MSSLFGDGGQTIKPIIYTGVQTQTSAQGLPIAIMWGVNALAPNIVDAFNFVATDTGKGKGLGKSGQDTYTASVILALCEGPIGHVGNVFYNGSVTTMDALGFATYTGTSDQQPWPYAESTAPAHALSYANTAYVCNETLALGSSAEIPQFRFEVYGRYHGVNVPSGTIDANMADIIGDFLTNPQYTLGMSPALVGDLSSLRTYHLAQGLFYSPILSQTEQVITTLDRWASIGNFLCFWDGSQIKFYPLGDSIITANGVTWTPNITPIYDLGLDDFISDSKTPPVVVTRLDPADGYNVVQLDINARGNKYNNTSVRFLDQSSIDIYGQLASNVISASEICNIGVGQLAANLIGKRSVYVRNNYEFTTSYRFILLEPGDIVTLTEPFIGLNRFPVRITGVQETQKGELKFTAEEYPEGIGTPAEFTPDSNQGGSLYDPLVSPGNTNPPAFLEPSVQLSGSGQPELWIALSGGEWWGGCGVFMSVDGGASYQQLGTQEGGCAQGTLTASVPLESGLDTTSTIAVDCTESDGIIPATATHQSAELYQTLALVDSELLSYGSSIPDGTFEFDLTYLYRGAFGTAPAAHSVGDPLSIISNVGVFKYYLPQNYVGQALMFKFPAANVFGNSPQTLDVCTAYTYVPSGSGYSIEPPTGIAVVQDNTHATFSASWTLSTSPGVLFQNVQYSIDAGATWTNQTVDATADTWMLTGITITDTYAARVQAVTSLGVSAWDSSI